MVNSNSFALSRPLKSKEVLVAFLAGLFGELYLPIPGIGILAIADMVAYMVAVPLLAQHWDRMGRYSKKAVLWGVAWTVAALFANALNFKTMQYYWACVFVIMAGWTLTLLLWIVFKNDARLFLWFLMGMGLGATVGMHYLPNGAYLGFMHDAGEFGVGGLIEKQIYPNYARTIVLFCGLFVCVKAGGLFSLFSSLLTIFAGIWMLFHGGSRSSFGIYLAAGLFGATVLLFPRLIRWLFHNVAVIIMVCLAGAFVLFYVYADLAKSGRLGEGEYNKFEKEEEFSEEYGSSRLSSRGSFVATWQVFKKKPWGEGGKLRRHSVISNSWNCEGLVGLLFWIYYFWMILWFMKNRISFSGKYATFFILLILINSWDIIGSPYGTRHKFFALLAFISLCRDNPMYGVPEIFGHPEQRR